MRKFKDSMGGEWSIALPFGEIERVKAESEGKFDLLDPHGSDLAGRLLKDIREFWEVLAYLVSPQIDEAKLTARDFGLRMGPAELVAAQLLFIQEWADFFRQLQRPDVAEALERLLEVQATAVQVVTKRIEEDPTLKTLATDVTPAMSRRLDKSFSDLRDTLASILNATPGGPSTSEPKEGDTNPAA